MAREPNPPDSFSPADARRPRLRWWLVAGAAGLLTGEVVGKLRSGEPFAVSMLDALVLVALVIVLGTYAILARAEREQGGGPGDEGGPPATGEPPT